MKAQLRADPAALDPFALKKSRAAKLKKFFTLLGNLDRASPKTCRSPAAGNLQPGVNSGSACRTPGASHLWLFGNPPRCRRKPVVGRWAIWHRWLRPARDPAVDARAANRLFIRRPLSPAVT